MADIEKIKDHEEKANNRLTGQFKDLESWEKLLRVFTPLIQELEDVFCDLQDKVWIENGEGVQLDRIGAIVDQDRLGFDDATYRILLYAAIIRNKSNGEPENVINVFRLMSQSTVVYLQEIFDAKIGLIGDGSIDPSIVGIVAEQIERTMLAGVALDYLGLVDPDEPFAFEGSPGGLGFSEIANPTSGGKLASLFTFGKPFAFKSTSSDRGFGTLSDSSVGGRLETL